jgi:hypothetical protein
MEDFGDVTEENKNVRIMMRVWLPLSSEEM